MTFSKKYNINFTPISLSNRRNNRKHMIYRAIKTNRVSTGDKTRFIMNNFNNRDNKLISEDF